jgi:hypothetical protein
MYKGRWIFLPLFMLFGLFGCAHQVNVNVTSIKDVTYNKKLDRILVSLSVDKFPMAFGNPIHFEQKITQVFTDKLNKRGVIAQTVVPNPLELESGTAMKAAVATFQPHQVMDFGAISMVSSPNGPGNLTLEGSIYDTATKKRVWRASIRLSGFLDDAQTNADKLVDAVIQKLQTDGLLLAL